MGLAGYHGHLLCHSDSAAQRRPLQLHLRRHPRDVAGEFSELGPALAVRLGGRRVYTLLTLGETNERAAVPAWGVKTGVLLVELGLGLHAQVRTWSVDNEVLLRRMYFSDVEGQHLIASYRVAFGLPLSGSLRLVFGPSLNAFFDLHKGLRSSPTAGRSATAGWPGAFVGIRF